MSGVGDTPEVWYGRYTWCLVWKIHQKTGKKGTGEVKCDRE